MIVTSGAIARGIHLLGLGTRPRVVEELQAASAVGQGRLYRTYDEYLRECGIQSAQVLLTFFDMSARTHYLNARRTLRTLVDWRIVPVINENDTTTTDEISFGDNDFLAAQVAVLVDASLLLLLTSHRGAVHGRSAVGRVGAARRDRRPTPPSSRRCRSPPRRRRWARAGCARRSRRPRWRRPPAFPTVIGSGYEPGVLARAWAGEATGTRFAPHPVRQPSFKLWLKYAKPSQGSVVVDAGAARALREGGTSLLPVGIVAVEGAFEAGDAVDVRCTDAAVGKGISNYSAAELRRVMGMKSGAGARSAAAGDRRGRAPRLLRAGLGPSRGAGSAGGSARAAPSRSCGAPRLFLELLLMRRELLAAFGGGLRPRSGLSGLTGRRRHRAGSSLASLDEVMPRAREGGGEPDVRRFCSCSLPGRQAA